MSTPEIFRLRRRVEVLEEGTDLAVEQVAPSVWTVPSRSQPGDFHIVSQFPNGDLVCSCEHNRHGQECRHIIAIQLVQEREARARTERPLPSSKRQLRKEVALT